MGYVIFRGVGTEGSLSVVGSGHVLTDVYVSKMPSHKKAAMRQTEYHVTGRDGDLHINEGFENFDITLVLVLVNATVDKRQLVNAWADGTGQLILSDDLTKYYKATVQQEVEWNRVPGNGKYYDTATIVFNCQPFMYAVSEQNIVVSRPNPGSITNLGTAEAFPLLKAEGSGTCDFGFCGEYIILYDVSANDPVYIDCETGYIYTQSGTAKSMVGNIPKIPLGTSQVVFNLENGMQTLTVTPRWRWV